jgi:hypothetical protein
MGAGASDAEATRRGPALALKVALSTTVVVPSIAASVNNAAAITTAESKRLPGAKKTPRLREDRAARVGGKR